MTVKELDVLIKSLEACTNTIECVFDGRNLDDDDRLLLSHVAKVHDSIINTLLNIGKRLNN